MESGEKKTGTRLKAELKTERERGVTGKRNQEIGQSNRGRVEDIKNEVLQHLTY